MNGYIKNSCLNFYFITLFYVRSCKHKWYFSSLWYPIKYVSFLRYSSISLKLWTMLYTCQIPLPIMVFYFIKRGANKIFCSICSPANSRFDSFFFFLLTNKIFLFLVVFFFRCWFFFFQKHWFPTVYLINNLWVHKQPCHQLPNHLQTKNNPVLLEF